MNKKIRSLTPSPLYSFNDTRREEVLEIFEENVQFRWKIQILNIFGHYEKFGGTPFTGSLTIFFIEGVSPQNER